MSLPLRIRRAPALIIPTAESSFHEFQQESNDQQKLLNILSTLGRDFCGFVEGGLLHSLCEQLSSLCANNVFNAKYITQQGGIYMLLNSVQCYMLHLGLTTDIFVLLYQLYVQYPWPLEAVVKMIPLMADVLFNHFNNPLILKVLCKFSKVLLASDHSKEIETAMIMGGFRVFLNYLTKAAANVIENIAFGMDDASPSRIHQMLLNVKQPDPPEEVILWGLTPTEEFYFVYINYIPWMRRLVNALKLSNENYLGFTLSALGLVHEMSATYSPVWKAFPLSEAIPGTSELIEAMVDIVRIQSTREEIVALVTRILGNFCQDEELQQQMGQAGAIELLLSLLHEYDDNEILLLWTLAAMVDNNPKNQFLFTKAGGIATVLKSMSVIRPNNLAVHMRQMHILSNLAFSNTALQDEIINLEGIPIILKILMKAVEDQPDVGLLQESVVVSACLSERQQNRRLLVQEGVVDPLLFALSTLWMDPVIMDNVTRCLANLKDSELLTSLQVSRLSAIMNSTVVIEHMKKLEDERTQQLNASQMAAKEEVLTERIRHEPLTRGTSSSSSTQMSTSTRSICASEPPILPPMLPMLVTMPTERVKMPSQLSASFENENNMSPVVKDLKRLMNSNNLTLTSIAETSITVAQVKLSATMTAAPNPTSFTSYLMSSVSPTLTHCTVIPQNAPPPKPSQDDQLTTQIPNPTMEISSPSSPTRSFLGNYENTTLEALQQELQSLKDHATIVREITTPSVAVAPAATNVTSPTFSSAVSQRNQTKYSEASLEITLQTLEKQLQSLQADTNRREVNSTSVQSTAAATSPIPRNEATMEMTLDALQNELEKIRADASEVKPTRQEGKPTMQEALPSMQEVEPDMKQATPPSPTTAIFLQTLQAELQMLKKRNHAKWNKSK